MENIIIISVILAVAAAAPALYLEDHSYIHTPVYPVLHELSSAKSTVTKSSQVVNHGGTEIVHAPVYHTPHLSHPVQLSKSTVTKSSQVVNHGGTAVVHAPVYHVSHVPVVHELSSAKSTVTKSSQVVNHGGTAVLHAPVAVSHVPSVSEAVHGGVVHTPVYSTMHVYDYAPVAFAAGKTGDSAVSHHSSTVHETEPVVNHYPLYFH